MKVRAAYTVTIQLVATSVKPTVPVVHHQLFFNHYWTVSSATRINQLTSSSTEPTLSHGARKRSLPLSRTHLSQLLNVTSTLVTVLFLILFQRMVLPLNISHWEEIRLFNLNQTIPLWFSFFICLCVLNSVRKQQQKNKLYKITVTLKVRFDRNFIRFFSWSSCNSSKNI